MKTQKLIYSILFLSLLFSNNLYSQKGIFYYPDTAQLNTQIIDIKENRNNGEIYLLGNTTDISFEHTTPYFARTDKNGKLLFSKFFDTEVYNICNIVLNGEDVKIYGSQNYSGFSQYSKDFDKNGETTNNNIMMDMTSGMLQQVVDLGTGKSLRLSSRRKDQYFNIRISLLDNKLGYAAVNFPIKANHNELADDYCMLKDSSLIIIGKSLNDEFTTYESVMHHYSLRGDSLWTADIQGTKNNTSQYIEVDKNYQIYYIYSLAYNDYSTEAFLSTVSSSGQLSNQKTIEEFIPNGMLSLSNGNMLLYGYKYVFSGNNVMKKAKFIIVNNRNEVIKKDEITESDPPDTAMPSYEFVLMPSSSEFLSATQLSDGRIALGGRVYYPVNPTVSGDNQRLNKPLLLLMTQDGMFR